MISAMITLGLTGSIGMGKSTVTALLRAMGIPVHDADQAVHDLLAAGGKGVDVVGERFPDALQKNAENQKFIDRKILGAALHDPKTLQQLETILHPLVFEEAEIFKQQMQQDGHELVVLDIPLLFEKGAEHLVDKTVCISAPADVQRERVLSRPGMTQERLDAVLALQLPDAEKRRRADFVIENDRDIPYLQQQLNNVVEEILPVKEPAMQSVSEQDALYPGSFDPFTLGHLDIARQSINKFDRLVIAVGYNPDKKGLLPHEDRVILIEKSIAESDIDQQKKEKISVISYANNVYTVVAAVQHNCGTLARGFRDENDQREEEKIALFNKNICEDLNLPQIETCLFQAAADKAHISSSAVKLLMACEGWEKTIGRYVPPAVLQHLTKPKNG